MNMTKHLLEKFLIVTVIACGVMKNAYGQMPELSSYVPNPVVYSPQATEMMNYDQMPVNMSTGKVEMSISLLDIKDRDFNFPLVLNYNSGGFKPNQPDSYVGRDWTLNCGGIIYRQIRGLPDDIEQYYTFTPGMHEGEQEYFTDGFMKLIGRGKYNMDEMRANVLNNPKRYACRSDDYAPVPTLTGTNIESSPDMYYFNFGKHSGKFMLNYDGSISVIGYDGHRYEVDLSEYEMAISTYAHSTRIRIKTDDGFVYTFGGETYGPIEYSAASWEKNSPMNSYDVYRKHTINAWYLSEITAPNGRKLVIHYKDIDEKYHKDLKELLDIGFLPESERNEIASLYSLSGHSSYISKPVQNPGVVSESYLRDVPAKKANANFYNLNKIALIDYISTDAWEIRFHYSLKDKYTKIDNYLHEGYYKFRGAKLDSLKIVRKEGTSETCSFGYDYQCDNRLFLRELNHPKLGKYQFNYNWINESVLLGTTDIDHWGYWLGRKNDEYVYPGNRYIGDYRSQDYELTTNHRDALGGKCEATLLSLVIFPTGGKAEFRYEPHRYTFMNVQNETSLYEPSQIFAREKIAGGARIRKIYFYNPDSDVATKEILYTYLSEDGMEGVLMYMPFYRYLSMFQYGNYVYTQLVENSDGIGSQYNPSQHIWYSTVNEYYIDPLKGTVETNSPRKMMKFYVDPNSPDYTGYTYVTSTNPEYAPNAFTLGLLSREYFLKNRFCWSGRSQSYKNGKILEEWYFNAEGKPVKFVDYEYRDVYPQDYSLCMYTSGLQFGTNHDVYTHLSREFFGMNLLRKKSITEYGDNWNVNVREEELYEHDEAGYLKKKISILSNNDSLVTSYRYLDEIPSLITDIEQQLRKSKGTKYIKSEHIDYRMQTSSFVTKPWPVVSAYSVGTDPLHLEEREIYPIYDRYGNPVQIIKDGVSVIYIWGYNGQHLVAKIENATLADLVGIIGEINIDTFQPSREELHALRVLLPQARVTSYTYKPLVGITSITNYQGIHTYYEYDPLGRLQIIRDDDGEVERIYDYQYSITN